MANFILHIQYIYITRVISSSQHGFEKEELFHSLYAHIHTIPMTGRKSRMLEPLAFDEYCSFDTSVFFRRIKQSSLYSPKESRSIKTAIFIES